MQTSSAVIAALLFSATALFAQEPPPVSEVINVERIILDVRVVDTFGKPIPNLKPGDFRVRVGNKLATVVAAEWIDETKPPELPELPADATDGETPAIPEMQSGRILVFFFQNDFGRANMRVVGHMKVLSTIDSLIDRLQPDDRVAVFSYDSQLKFRLDLTSDKAKIRGEVSKTLAIDNPSWPAAADGPSLGKNLDRQRMRDAATPERALRVVSDALQSLPGRKSLLFFGWGLGHRGSGEVSMGWEFKPLIESLTAARTSLFSIDLAQQGHQLAIALKAAAETSGGMYVSTAGFIPDVYDRIAGTLSGYYELEVRTSEPRAEGDNDIRIDLPKDRNAKVMQVSAF